MLFCRFVQQERTWLKIKHQQQKAFMENFEFRSSRIGFVRSYKQPVDGDLVEKIQAEIDRYVEKFGQDPSALILGYGSYLSACYVLSKRQTVAFSTGFHTEYEIWVLPEKYWDINIVIDPGYEYRIAAVPHWDNPLDIACHCVMESKKSKPLQNLQD